MRQFSAILEPTNLTRRIYGFDSFEGFPDVTDLDMSSSSKHVKKGDLKSDSFEELNINEYKNNFSGSGKLKLHTYIVSGFGRKK